MKTWLIIDSNYIARRALYSMGNLSHGDVKTGMLYGFFKDVQTLQDHFGTPHVVFCFDYGKGLRKKFFPEYKMKRHRKELTPEELEIEIAYKEQEAKLRALYLPKLGYNNIFYQEGYEGDDIVASITQNLPTNNEAIIITADQDLYQLIKERVKFYDPKKMKMVTIQSFKKEYGIEAKEWWKVKAVGGCKTDEVPGVQGVAEKTAIKYLLGQLKPNSVVYKRIRSAEGLAIRKRNIKLVRLPYKGTKTFKLTDDNVTDAKWRRMCDNLGFASMRDKKIRTPRKNFGINNG